MAMAFDVTLTGVESEAVAQAAFDAFHRDLLRADDLFSLFRQETVMSRLANGQLAIADAPSEVIEVLELCDHYRIATGGAFDAKRPDGVIDPTGVVKTWAVTKATARLASVPSWLVSASGDVLAHGGERRVGIADPRVSGDPAGTGVVDVVTVGGSVAAVATSGSAQVADHIWDPMTGEPARHFLQVSVAGADLVACDAWATAICAGGAPLVERAAAAGLELLIVAGERSQGGFEAVSTPGWPTTRES